MKLSKGILAAVMMMGGAWAQNPNIINNVQNQMTAVQQKQTADSNAVLGIQSSSTSAQAKKPSPVASAPMAKPASVTAAKPATASKTTSSAMSKAASSPATKKVSAESSNNKLERVKVIRGADDVQIEMATRGAVTPTVDRLTSPERVVVELPATAMATAQSRIAVGAAGIKGVRIGVNGKTPPTTSVVVDLEHAVSYEISQGPSDKVVLTLHVPGATQGAAIAKKSSAAPAIAKAQPMQKAGEKPAVVASVAAPKTMATKLATAKPVIVAKAQTSSPAPKASKPATVHAAPKVAVATKVEAPKAASAAAKPAKVTIAASKEAPKAATTQTAKSAADDKLPPIATTADASEAPKPEEKKWAMNGKRDPFFSPVVQQATGSGCSTGKKCLEIGQINVRGIVKSEAGFIAVVTNSLNKAYFLHENDPVFNGYVLRITGDSVVFQETYQDKFGKPLTREVTKTVVAPAV
jgi:hypothetical protein